MHALNASNFLALGILEEAYSTYEETIKENQYAQNAPVDQKHYNSREHFVQRSMKKPLDRFVQSNSFLFRSGDSPLYLNLRDISTIDSFAGISNYCVSHSCPNKASRKNHLPSFNAFFCAVEKAICLKLICKGEFENIPKNSWLDDKALDAALEIVDDRINRLANIGRSQLYESQRNRTENDINVPDLLVFKSLKSLSCNVDGHDVRSHPICVQLVNKPGFVKLPAYKCLTCGRTFVGEQTLKLFTSEFGIPFAACKCDTSCNVDFSSFGMSELYSYSYNVRQDGMSQEERQSLLTLLLKSGKMSRFEIVRDIENAINLFEGRLNYIDAVHKWKEDLKFVNCFESSDL